MASRHKTNVVFIFMFVSSSLPAREEDPHELLQTAFIDVLRGFWCCHSFIIISKIFSASSQILKVNMESTFNLHREIFMLWIQLLTILVKVETSNCSVEWVGWTTNIFPWYFITTASQPQFFLLQLTHHQLLVSILSHKKLAHSFPSTWIVPCSRTCQITEVTDDFTPLFWLQVTGGLNLHS